MQVKVLGGVQTMLSERRMRRALYVVTGLGWGFAVLFAVLDVKLGVALPFARAVLIVSVAAAATLSNVTLFAVIVAPLEKVYRHGYEAGQRSAVVEPAVVLGRRPTPRAPVIPIRRLEPDRFGRG